MVATDSSRSSVRTRYAAPHPGPPPRLSVAVAGPVGFGGCVVSIDPWRLWLLCGYFATTFLSAPPRRGAGPAGKSRGSGAAVDRLMGVHDGCVQGFDSDVTHRPQPPACGVAHRERRSNLLARRHPRGVLSCARRRERTAGYDVSPIRGGPHRPGGSSAGRIPVTTRVRDVVDAGPMGPGRGAWRLSPLWCWCYLYGERRCGRRPLVRVGGDRLGHGRDLEDRR